MRLLRRYFLRNGYTRSVDEVRRERDGHRVYKKGYEIRFVAFSEDEAQQIFEALGVAGFRPGSPWLKFGRIIVPVYGKAQTERLLAEMDAAGSSPPR
jgi:hypothetical protein